MIKGTVIVDSKSGYIAFELNVANQSKRFERYCNSDEIWEALTDLNLLDGRNKWKPVVCEIFMPGNFAKDQLKKHGLVEHLKLFDMDDISNHVKLHKATQA